MTLPEPGSAPIPDEQVRIATERERLQRDAVGGSFWTAVQVVLGLPFAVVANAVVAHRLGAGAYGTLAIYMAIFGVITAVINGGISAASVQWIATYKAKADQSGLLEVIRRCSGFHVLVEAPLFAVAAAVLLRGAGTEAMVVGGLAAALVEIVGTSTIIMSGTALNALAARISLVAAVAGQTAIIGIAATSPFASSIFIGRVVAGLLGPLLAFFLIPKDVRWAMLHPRIPRGWPEGFMPFAVRTCGSVVIASMVFGRSELFVFEAYDRAHQAGLFALAAGVAGLITAPIDSLLGPLLPATAGLLAISPDRAGSALLRGLRTSALLAGLVGAVGIPILAPLLPLIYGRSFSGVTAAFVVLAVVSCVQSVNHPVEAFLLAAHKTGLLLAVGLFSVVLDFGIAFATIPSLGLAGAVIASSAAQLLTLGVVAYRVGQIVGVSTWDQVRSVGYLVDALVVGGIAFLAEYVGRDLPDVAIAAVGLGSALVAAAVVGRVRRTGLEASDIAVIDDGLPAALRPLFRATIRMLSLQAR